MMFGRTLRVFVRWMMRRAEMRAFVHASLRYFRGDATTQFFYDNRDEISCCGLSGKRIHNQKPHNIVVQTTTQIHAHTSRSLFVYLGLCEWDESIRTFHMEHKFVVNRAYIVVVLHQQKIHRISSTHMILNLIIISESVRFKRAIIAVVVVVVRRRFVCK